MNRPPCPLCGGTVTRCRVAAQIECTACQWRFLPPSGPGPWTPDRLETLWESARKPTTVQDSAPDLHPYVTLAHSIQPDWEGEHGKRVWQLEGVFACLVGQCDGAWYAMVTTTGPCGEYSFERDGLPNDTSAYTVAELSLWHLLRLQDASLFWEARDLAQLPVSTEEAL